MHDGQDFVPILYIAGVLHTINENNVLFFSDREITYLPIFMFTIVKYVRISLLVWTLFHKIIKCI
jgi:hypothetical protein